MRRTTARLRRGLAVLGLATLVGLGGTPPAVAEQPSRQDLLDAVHTAGMPGIQAAVRHGDRVWTGAAGVADVRTDRPLRPGFHHRVGSITKTFTATAVLQQVSAGRIDLDAPIGDYLPNLVPGQRGHRITVRMLLNHTSGIGDYDTAIFSSLAEGSLADVEANRWRHHSPEELIRIGLDQPPTGAPGERFAYSNTNYVIAGQLLEKVTGLPAELVITRDVIRPLGLRDTYFPGSLPFILGPHSKAYSALYHLPDEWGEYSVYNVSVFDTAGALISTPADIDTFYTALLEGRLLEPRMLAEMKRTVPVIDPVTGERTGNGYGLGLMRRELGTCGTYWGHDGLVFGMATMSLHSTDGSRHLTYATNLTRYHHLDENGMPKPHPIDRALNAFIIDSLCAPTTASTQDLTPKPLTREMRTPQPLETLTPTRR